MGKIDILVFLHIAQFLLSSFTDLCLYSGIKSRHLPACRISWAGRGGGGGQNDTDTRCILKTYAQLTDLLL